MSHFDHKAEWPEEQETPAAAARRARHGMVLFLLYLALYLGFMLLNVYDPALMERTPVAGLNVAILYGFSLIIAALVLALVYAWLCRARPGEFEVQPPPRNPNDEIRMTKQ